jgi:hypothetical protein
VVHTKRRASLCERVVRLKDTVNDTYSDISHTLESTQSPAVAETKCTWPSLAIICGKLALELDNLRVMMETRGIPRLSGFWFRACRVVFDVAEGVRTMRDIKEQLESDLVFRRDTTMHDARSSQVCLEGFRLQSFESDVQDVKTLLARVARDTFLVNRSVMGTPKKISC